MKRIKLAIVAFVILFCTQMSKAVVYSSEYVPMGHQSGALWQPTDPSARNGIGIVVMHSDMDYMNFVANSELATRGFTVLGSIPSSGDIITDKVSNIATCVKYLRSLSYIRHVILLGHSGGATTMSAYALLAEQGAKAIEDIIYKDYDTKIIEQLPAVDGLILLDPNYGMSTMMLVSLDPNVTDESKGMDVEEKLNLGDVAVGYNPDGNSVYTEEFIKKFGRAQGERMTRLTELANERLAEIKEGKGQFADNEPMVIAGASLVRFNNKLFAQDTLLLNHTRNPHTLLHPDGVETIEIVHTVRPTMSYRDNTMYLGTAANTTVRGFLSMFAIKCKDVEVLPDGIAGVDFGSNINNAIGNVRGITVPLLCMGMTGSWEFIAAEMAYDNSASADKTVVFVDGAEHMIYPMAHKYGDTVKTTFDYMAAWLSSRF